MYSIHTTNTYHMRGYMSADIRLISLHATIHANTSYTYSQCMALQYMPILACSNHRCLFDIASAARHVHFATCNVQGGIEAFDVDMPIARHGILEPAAAAVCEAGRGDAAVMSAAQMEVRGVLAAATAAWRLPGLAWRVGCRAFDCRIDLDSSRQARSISGNAGHT